MITRRKEPAALLILRMIGVSCRGGCAGGTPPTTSINAALRVRTSALDTRHAGIIENLRDGLKGGKNGGESKADLLRSLPRRDEAGTGCVARPGVPPAPATHRVARPAWLKRYSLWFLTRWRSLKPCARHGEQSILREAPQGRSDKMWSESTLRPQCSRSSSSGPSVAASPRRGLLGKRWPEPGVIFFPSSQGSQAHGSRATTDRRIGQNQPTAAEYGRDETHCLSYNMILPSMLNDASLC